jgi:hypothetical protein
MRQLIGSALETAGQIGSHGACVLYRWQDPSGVRLVIVVEGQQVVGFLPSFAGRPGARLAQVRAVNQDVVAADVLDQAGEQVTRLATELEQQRILPDGPLVGPASIVALGIDVSVHASAEAFAASDASLVSGAGNSGEAPKHFVDNGWPWPPRMAAESFISYGVFNSPETMHAQARLNALVLAADIRTVSMTGQRFIAARVRSAGFEADVCMPADESTAPPSPGNIVAGTVYLVASMPELDRK